MRYLIIIAALIAGFAYFYFTGDPGFTSTANPTPTPPPPPTPAEQISAFLGKKPVAAVNLARLTDTYPQIAQSILTNQLMTVNGKIGGFLVSGIDNNKLDVLLITGSQRTITIRFDLNKYAVASLATNQRDTGRYVKIGRELHYVSRDGKDRQLLYAEGETLQQKARFERILPPTILLNAEN